MKLNLGSGGMLWPGWVNFDQRIHKRGNLKTDVVGNINNPPFQPASFDEIVCVHVIEHFYKTDAIAVIKACYDLLCIGGKLIMEGPDILGCYWLYVEMNKDVSRFIDFIYGGEDSRVKFGNEYAHKCGWTRELMAKEMEKIGFKILVIGIGRHHGMGKRDFRVEGVK